MGFEGLRDGRSGARRSTGSWPGAVARRNVMHMTGSREFPDVQRPAAAFLVAEGTLEAPLRVAQTAAASSRWPVLVVGESGTGRRTIANAYARGRAPDVRLTELKRYEDVQTVLQRLRNNAIDSAETVFVADLNLLQPDHAALVETLGRESAEDPSAHLRVVASLRLQTPTTVLLPEAAPGWLRVEIPSLRDRPEEALRLLRHFAGSAEPKVRFEIERAAAGLALLYDWPGNVIEVRSMVEQLRIESATQVFTGEALRARMRPSPPLPADLVQVRRARCLLALILAGDASLASKRFPYVVRADLQDATGTERRALGRALDALVQDERITEHADGKSYAVSDAVVTAFRYMATDLSIEEVTGGAAFVRSLPPVFPSPSARQLLWAVIERGELGDADSR